jgi:predicted negative regulator of RcsB-dependent stress response
MTLEMMDEHERGERVRAWVRQNGSSIVTGIALGLAAIFGYQWWQGSKVEHRVTAATQYQALTDAVERKDAESVGALTDELAKNYQDTPYAALGALQLADLKLAAGDAEAAKQALQRASQLSPEPALAALASLRLARATLAAGDAEGALKLADGASKDLYAGLYAELRGDALHKLGRPQEAAAAYQDALTMLDTAAPNRRLIEMKLTDLGAAPSAPEA